MSKDTKQKKQPFNLITGMWKRYSANRVGKDNKPEPYYYGTVKSEEDIVLRKGTKIFLYPHTNWKKGHANFFLKFQEPSEEEETEEVSTEAV
tara:strand:+ start:1117 stop:1392 length:276 start_codon:yes stop_codon:yes gene_type:complete